MTLGNVNNISGPCKPTRRRCSTYSAVLCGENLVRIDLGDRIASRWRCAYFVRGNRMKCQAKVRNYAEVAQREDSKQKNLSFFKNLVIHLFQCQRGNSFTHTAHFLTHVDPPARRCSTS
jgi:hypothetical protein